MSLSFESVLGSFQWYFPPLGKKRTTQKLYPRCFHHDKERKKPFADGLNIVPLENWKET